MNNIEEYIPYYMVAVELDPNVLSKEYEWEGIHFIESVSPEITANRAGNFITSIVRENPNAVITFATGATMEPVLESLVASEIDATGITGQHLDEYVGADPDEDDESFVRFLRQRAFYPLAIQTVHEMRGRALNPEEEAERYEEIVSSRPVDLVILGIGPGGHIAFNEVGTPFDLGVHVQRLAVETVERDVQRGQTRREEALTQGPRNIINGNNIMMVLYGEQKGEWLGDCLANEISPNYPAAILRLPDIASKVTVFLDEPAAKAIAKKLGQ